MRTCILAHMKKMIILLLGSAVLGVMLLTLVFCIPEKFMKGNVISSVDRMIPNEDEGSAFLQYIRRERETYTDVIMVQNAVDRVEGKSSFEHAMWVYHYDLEEDIWAPEETLKVLHENWDTSRMFLHEYSRYWHGYLVYLKPLLMIFSWQKIIVLGVLVHAILMIAIFILSVHKKNPGIGIAMLIGFFFMKPVLVVASLAMSVCWGITLTALLCMLLYHNRFEQQRLYPEAFLMIGILTAYFDFLTYPAVTLGFPLCAYFLLKKRGDLKQNLGRGIGYSTSWGIGYVGMWGMKWVIADLILHTGTIKDAVWSIIIRSEVIGGRPRLNGGWYTISLNLQEYGGKVYFAAAVLIAVLTFIALVFACRALSPRQIMAETVPYVLIFCIPFVWIIAIQNHSALHGRFTFRIISVAAVAVCCAGISFIRAVRERNGAILDMYRYEETESDTA